MLSDVVLKMMKLVDTSIGIPKYTFEMQSDGQKKPAKEFAAVKLLNEAMPGQDEYKTIVDEATGEIIQRVVSCRVVTFLVLFSEGRANSHIFQSSLRRQAMLDAMGEHDLAILGMARASNKTIALETNWEIRDGLIVAAMTRRVDDQVVDSMDEVEVKGGYHEGDTFVPIKFSVKG